MKETAALAKSQTPSLLIEAMGRRPRAVSGKCVPGGGRAPSERPNAHNNYIAESPRHPGKVGAPFGNRNAFKPELAERRALLAKVAAHIARMKAAIAAVEALVAARKAPARPTRRIVCVTEVVDGVVRRERVVMRIKPRAVSNPLPLDVAGETVDMALQTVQMGVEREGAPVQRQRLGLLPEIFQHTGELRDRFELARIEVHRLLQRNHCRAIVARVLLQQTALMPAFRKARRQDNHFIAKMAGDILVADRERRVGPAHQQIDRGTARSLKGRQDLRLDRFGVFRRFDRFQVFEQFIHRRIGRRRDRRDQRQQQNQCGKKPAHGAKLNHPGGTRVAPAIALWPGINPGAP